MTRLLVLLAALVLYVAPPVVQAFAASHVRPPGAELVHPTSTNTESTRGTFGTFLSDNHEAFRTYGLIIGAVAGLSFAVWRARIANKQAMASQRQAHAAYEQAQAGATYKTRAASKTNSRVMPSTYLRTATADKGQQVGPRLRSKPGGVGLAEQS